MIKILAIDDNKDNLISIKALIWEAFPDASVITAMDGPEGIELARLEKPDLILLDVIMPGMDGFEVCQELKKEESLKFIPVVFLTALKETRENRIRALESGAEGFLTKPIDEAELIAQVKVMLKINQAHKEKLNENERLNALVEERTSELSQSREEALKLLDELRDEIEAHKKTESALKESEMRWSTTVASIGDAVISTDLNGRITFINAEAERITGWSREEAESRPIAEVYRIMDEKTLKAAEIITEEVIRTGKKEKIPEHTILLSRYERPVPVDDSAAPIRLPDGRVIGVVVVFRDISERKLAEDLIKKHGRFLEEEVKRRTAELEQAKLQAESADRLKSAFLANLSHELRTPLNSIIGFSGVLLKGFPGPLNQEQIKQIGMIQSSGKHLLSLINDILDLSKIESGQMSINYELVDLHEILDDVIRLQRPIAFEKGLSLHLSMNSEMGLIESDRQRIKQIILNLVNNAIKFTNEGAVEIICNRENHTISITVTDTGTGIKQEDYSKLFKPFTQIEDNLVRSNEGSGLGLSICKKLTELLNGHISVESQYGKGSAFTVSLPVQVSK